MRFTGMSLSLPAKGIEREIELTGGINTIAVNDPFLAGIVLQAPCIGLYGRGTDGNTPDEIAGSDEFSVKLETENSGATAVYSFEKGIQKHTGKLPCGLFSFEDFILYSCITDEYPEDGTDPALNSRFLKSFFISRESDKESRKEVYRLEEVLAAREREINELNKKKQLLELKKLKKDKLIKEVSGSEKELGRLQRKKNSYIVYRNTLVEVQELLREDAKLSSKIINLKKEIIELREYKEKLFALEKEIALRFPQFSDSMIEMIPDLDRLQNHFSEIRDINELLGKSELKKKRKISLLKQGISGAMIFSVISILFIIIKSIIMTSLAGMILGILSALSVLFSAAAAYYIFLTKNSQLPDDLISRKKSIEKSLIEIFKEGNLPVKDFGTGELYEYLFQYFEDFLSFIDLQGEYSAIKKRFSSPAILEDTENKLVNIGSGKERTENDIEKKLHSLDVNIHPVPEQGEIQNVIPEIDEMISDMEKNIFQRTSIAKKIGDEAKHYESGEITDDSLDNSISEIETEIGRISKDMEDILFMKQVFDETSESWFAEKLDDLSEKSAGIYLRMTPGIDEKDNISAAIKELLKTGSHGEFRPEDIKLLQISVKIALADICMPELNPPLIMNEPFSSLNALIAENIKKILLEMSDKRQVVIITSKSSTDLAGNLINF